MPTLSLRPRKSTTVCARTVSDGIDRTTAEAMEQPELRRLVLDASLCNIPRLARRREADASDTSTAGGNDASTQLPQRLADCDGWLEQESGERSHDMTAARAVMLRGLAATH